MSARFLADQPLEHAAEDELNFAPFIDLLQRELEGAETPFVYGLLGESGAGRTSVLRLLEARLKQTREAGAGALVPIAFNARLYQNDVNLIYPLLYAVRQAYQSDRRITALSGARGFGGMFARVAATSALAATDVALRGATHNVAGAAPPLKDLREQLEAVRQQPDNLEGILRAWADTISQLHTGFEALLGTYAGDLARADPRPKVEDIRFAFLVDDLDRCSPETLLSTLEATRQFLSGRRAIFVIALNAERAVQAVARQLRAGADDGRQVLEATLHATAAVPEPAPEQVRQFARQQLQRLLGDPHSTPPPALDSAIDSFGQTLADCRIANPRKIKRLINGFVRFLDRNQSQLEQFPLPNIVRLLVLAEVEPGLFRAYQADPERVSVELAALGSPDFSLAAFEQAHAVRARAAHPRLSLMRKLFQFEADPDRPGLRQQIDVVAALTRWS